MKNATPFQLFILGIFAVTAVLGIFFLATFEVNEVPEEERVGQIIIWGTYDRAPISAWLSALASRNENLSDISYQEFSKTNFNQELLEALAEQRAPDLLLLDNSEVAEQYNRIITLDGQTVSKSAFRQTYLQLAESYFVPDGTLGLPLFADPLILFWNRTLFQSAGEVKPPITWQDFFRILPLFTEVEDNFVINKTTLPFGEAVNVNNYKEIIATLAMQAGNPLVASTQNGYQSLLVGTSQVPSAFQALDFFTEFSNPTTDSYSWNRSLPTSQDFFLANRSATYVGFASEIRPIQLKNPNLNFDIAEIPQSQTASSKSVYARLYGLFIPTQAKNPANSFKAMNILVSQGSAEILQDILKLGVVRRDLAGQTASDDLFTDIFRKEAIYAQTFIDPDYEETNRIYRQLVESVTSGQKDIDEALRLADQEIQALFNN